jgi:phage terminase large subunit GpA-like protein
MTAEKNSAALVADVDFSLKGFDDIRAKWIPRPKVSTKQWFVDNLRLPKRISDVSGNFDLNTFPYQAGPLDAFDDIDVRVMSFQWGTQLGKTTMLHGLIPKIAATDPSPMMFAGPDEPSAKYNSERRIMPLVEAIPELADKLLPEGRRDTFTPDLGDCVLYMAWSGSPATTGQRSCRYVFCTELSKWNREKSDEADPADLVRERVKAFWDSKIIFEGTPTVSGICRMEGLEAAADQVLYFMVPCPKCGHRQPLTFKNLMFDRLADGKTNRELGERTARFECEKCKAKIRDEHKPRMLRGGIWAEKGADIPEGFKETIFYTPGKQKRRLHFMLNSLYSPVLTFADVVSEFILSTQRKGNKSLQNFINSWLAETWSPKMRSFRWGELKRVISDGTVPRGVVPAWAYFLTAGIDIGGQFSVYTIRAWGPGGRSRLIDWRQIPQPDSEIQFNELEAFILASKFKIEKSDKEMPVALAGVDSGFKAHEVYDWCRFASEKYGERVRPIKGWNKGSPYWMSAVDHSSVDGKRIEGGIQLWHVNDPYWKEWLTSKYSIKAGKAGAWEVPADADEYYMKSITSEVQKEKRNRQGQISYEWVVVDTKMGEIPVGNHFFDAEKIAAVMADMLGWREIEAEIEAEKVRKGKPEPVPEKTEADGGFLDGSDNYWGDR